MLRVCVFSVFGILGLVVGCCFFLVRVRERHPVLTLAGNMCDDYMVWRRHTKNHAPRNALFLRNAFVGRRDENSFLTALFVLSLFSPPFFVRSSHSVTFRVGFVLAVATSDMRVAFGSLVLNDYSLLFVRKCMRTCMYLTELQMHSITAPASVYLFTLYFDTRRNHV